MLKIEKFLKNIVHYMVDYGEKNSEFIKRERTLYTKGDFKKG